MRRNAKYHTVPSCCHVQCLWNPALHEDPHHHHHHHHRILVIPDTVLSYFLFSHVQILLNLSPPIIRPFPIFYYLLQDKGMVFAKGQVDPCVGPGYAAAQGSGYWKVHATRSDPSPWIGNVKRSDPQDKTGLCDYTGWTGVLLDCLRSFMR